ncbi:DUF1343 domain-containing protein [Candidatus Dependentiae bacterium]|nr:DUF1343 domain-containing protein [Candidatus Dependentiae bacterium]
MKKLFLITLFIFNSVFSQIDFGQKFIFALPNSDSKIYLKNWLQKTRPAGVMLQSFHLKNKDQVKDLINFLQLEAKKIGLPKLFVSIDWEGGIISRPNESNGFVSVPSPKNLACAGRTYCFLAGKLIGQQLRSIGINMNFAPCLDLFDSDNIVLGSRTFSSNPYNIFKFAQAFANGLKSENIIPVFKHFPGLGLSNLDTHKDKVNIHFNKKQFGNHLYPFIKILKREYNPFIMVGHARYPSLFGNKPASISKKTTRWIKKRNNNCFLITDDFAMNAVHIKKNLSDIALDSFCAGFDLIIFSAKNGQDIKLIQDLKENLDQLNNAQLETIKLGIERIKNFKNQNLINFKNGFILKEQKIAKFLASKSIKEFYRDIDFDKENLLISVDLPKLRTNEKWFIKNNNSYLKLNLEEKGVKLSEFVFDPNSSDSVNKILSTIKNNLDKNIILQTFFYGTGLHNKLQERLLKSFKDIQKNLFIISLGHPYEQNILPNAKIFNLGSFSEPMINEVAKRLLKNRVPLKDFSLKKLLHKLNNKKIGLLCHNASRINIKNREIFLPDFLLNFAKKQKNNTKLCALFSPEHGLQGEAGAYVHIESKKNSKWNCPVYSLHGKHKKPTKEMLRDLDLLVIDLHEVGVRVFTYLTTLLYCMEAAKEVNLPVLIIDHVNPIYFWQTKGPELKDGFKSLVGRVEVPFIHGKTIGEIARYLNKNINIKLDVLPTLKKNIKNYLKYNEFLAPSPNLVTIESVYSYPITVFLEGTNYSEGRGTRYPFQQFGAPWIDNKKLAGILNSKNLPGIYFEPIMFKPRSIQGKSINPKHNGKRCYGVFLHLYDPKNVQPMSIARAILKTLFELYPKELKLIKYSGRYFLDNLVGNNSWRKEFIKI